LTNGRVGIRAARVQAGASLAAAERTLKQELTRRQTPATGGAITNTTRVADLADAWLASAAKGWSITTHRLYRTVVAKHGLAQALPRRSFGHT
jgi:hypothetical protein